MAGFGDIPIRKNGIDQLIEASWFNTIRTKLIEAFGLGAYIVVQDVQARLDAEEIYIDPKAFKPLVPLVGDGGAVTLSNLPFGAVHEVQSGKEIVLMGTDDVNTVTLVSNDADEGLVLNGQSVVLRNYHKITLMYYHHTKRFIELERNF